MYEIEMISQMEKINDTILSLEKYATVDISS